MSKFNVKANFSIKAIGLWIVPVMLWMTACSPTKYLTEGQYLLAENNIEIIPENDTVKYDFEDYDIGYLIRPTPNSKLFLMRLNTRIYNMRNPNKIENAVKKYQKKKEKYIVKRQKLNAQSNRLRSNKRKYDKNIKKIEELDLRIRIIDKWLNKKNSLNTQNITINPDQNFRKTYKCKIKKEHKTNKLEAQIRTLKNARNDYPKADKMYQKLDTKLKKKQIKRDEWESENCNKLHWTRKAGEKPVLYKVNDEFRNIRQIRIYLKNKGYYSARVRAKASKGKHKKKSVTYTVYPNKPYTIKHFKPESKDSLLLKNNPKIESETILKSGTLLDIELLEKERTRIYEILRNNGYFKFSKDYIYYSIDTLNGNSTADVRLIIKLPLQNNKIQNHKQFKIRSVNIYPNYDPKAALTDAENYIATLHADSLPPENPKFIFWDNGENKLNPATIMKGAYIFKDSLYQNIDVKNSYKYLSSMKIIKIANIDFTQVEDTSLNSPYGYLDCNIKLTQNERQSYTAELETTNTSGDIGAAGNFIYSHKNLFKSAEVFDMKLKGALERKADNTDTQTSGQNAFFNSYELGVEMSLEFPRFFAPFDFNQFIENKNPKTKTGINLNILSRPDYKREIAGFSFGYFWTSSDSKRNIKHNLKPVLFDFVRLRNPSQEFLDYINRYKLYDSYEDHLIIGSSYSITFSNKAKKKDKQTYLRINGKIAGNSLCALMNIAGFDKTDNSYQILGSSFAQFAKLDADFRFYKKLHGNAYKLAARSYIGAVLPYGNLRVVPFGEKFFTGGANGIRAWQVRTLGPGSYRMPANIDVFPNQTADIKLELNLEYRMKLFWMLEGAFFIDAGNIWAINELDDRAGAQFHFDTFYKEIAVGTGIGFRFDFDFFIIRFDFGLKFRDPAAKEGERWIYFHRPMYKSDWAFNVGIGYPF